MALVDKKPCVRLMAGAGNIGCMPEKAVQSVPYDAWRRCHGLMKAFLGQHRYDLLMYRIFSGNQLK